MLQRLRIPLTFAVFLGTAFTFLSSYQNFLNLFPSLNNKEFERIILFFGGAGSTVAGLIFFDRNSPKKATDEKTARKTEDVTTVDEARPSSDFTERSRINRNIAKRIDDGTIESEIHIAKSHIRLGEYAPAERHLGKAKNIAEEGSDDLLLLKTSGEVFNLRGNMKLYRGDYDAAESNYNSAVDAAKSANDLHLLRKVYSNIGLLSRRKNDSKNALIFFRKSEEIAREINDLPGLFNVLRNLGAVYSLRREFSVADDCFKEAMGIIKNGYQDNLQIGKLYGNMSFHEIRRGIDFNKAREFAELGLKHKHMGPAGENFYIAYSEENLGILEMHTKNYGEARSKLESSLRRRNEVNDIHGMIRSHTALERLAELRKEPQDIETHKSARTSLQRQLHGARHLSNDFLEFIEDDGLLPDLERTN